MGTIRFFSGGREPGKKNIAAEMLRLEIQKNGKLPAADRFKMLLRKRLEENKQKLILSSNHGMSKKAQTALKEVAAKKAAKEAKKLRRMVIVQPKNFHNGRITQKGKIYDIAGNMVAEVNTKKGTIATMLGWNLGKYKPKKQSTHNLITNAIDKYSPYYINLRKMQQMQQAGLDPVTGQPLDKQETNVYGRSGPGGSGTMMVGNPSASAFHSTMASTPASAFHSTVPHDEPHAFQSYGESMGGPRQNIGMTAHGAVSDNIWGTFTDNVWGRSLDNAWGGNSTDIWGGVGGSPFGNGKSVKFFGTGDGKNYLKAATNFIAGLLGFTNKKNREALANYKNAQRGPRGVGSTGRGVGTSGPRMGGGGPRAGGGGGGAPARAPSAPVGRR